MNLETQEHTKRIEIHQSQIMTFWTRYGKVSFPKRSVKMIDGSEKRNCQLAFELQNSHVCEKRSNTRISISSWALCKWSSNSP